MKRTLHWIVVPALICLQPAFGQVSAGAPGQGPAGSPPPFPGPSQKTGVAGPEGTGGPPPLPKVDDKKFAKSAVMGSLAAVQLGKLASQKGSSTGIKQLGQKMVEEQTKAAGQLKQVARQGNFALPEALDSKRQSRIDKLAKLSGKDFEKAFLKDQIREDKTQVDYYINEAQRGMDPNVRAFARKILPAWQEQLQLARNLEKSGAQNQ